MRRDLNLPKRSVKINPKDFQFGTNKGLKAKSHSGSGSSLVDHSLQAARMALTVSETLVVSAELRDNIRIGAFIGGLYHDIGKAAAGFQEMIRNYKVNRWPPNKGGFRHEMLSAVIFLANSIEKEIWKKNKELLWACYLSIIVHHKPYKPKGPTKYPKPIKMAQWPGGGDFKQMYGELLLNKSLLQEAWQDILKPIQEDNWGAELLQKGWLPENLEIPPSFESAEQIYQLFMKNMGIPGYRDGVITNNLYHEKVSSHTTKFLSYVRAAVTVGDHLSSGNYLFLPPIPDLKRYQIFSEFEPRPFQSKCGDISGNLLLRAPTGSGKTEAAMSWIQKNQITAEERLGKVFFVLPYQASINAMHNRLAKWIEVELGLIGLQHSRAAQVLFGRIEKELYGDDIDRNLPHGKSLVKSYHDPWREISELKTIQYKPFSDLLLDEGMDRDYWSAPVDSQINTAASQIDRLSRENFYPLKVTTPHQLLGAVLAGRGWEVSVQEFEQACFVFDEIHIYDAHLTGLILGMAKVLIDQFNAKVLFMSASFPTFLIEKIEEYVDSDIPLIELDQSKESDREVLQTVRHKIQIQDKSIIEMCQDGNFVNQLLQKSSVLLICDTVSTAQSVYQILSGYDEITTESIMLFHSRYTMEDRKTKENQIMEIEDQELQFIVATQVVEVSLDIDLEFGIFEGAPLDALVQRLGRVNRKGDRDTDDINIIISQPTGYWHMVYDENTTNYSIELLKNIEGQPVTETDLVSLIDQLYSKIGWSPSQKKDFNRAYHHEKYQNFFDNVLPGTYSRWIDEVITDKSTMDVLYHQHVDEYEKRLKKTPLKALDLFIPTRVRKEDYTQKTKDSPRILKDHWKYSRELGLYKEK